MSTLTTHYHPVAVERPMAGLFARLAALLSTKNTTAASSDPVEIFIQNNGGVLTDQLEREISRRFGSMAGH